MIVFVPRPGDGPYRIPAVWRRGRARATSRRAGRHGCWYPPSCRMAVISCSSALSAPAGKRRRLCRLTRSESAEARSSTRDPVRSMRDQDICSSGGKGRCWHRRSTRHLQVHGDPVPVASAVGLNPLINQALFSVSDSGTLVFFAGVAGQSELAWVDRAGRRIGKAGPPGLSTACRCHLTTAVSSMTCRSAHGQHRLVAPGFCARRAVRLTFHPAHDMFPALVARRRPHRVCLPCAILLPSSIRAECGQRREREGPARDQLPKSPTGWSADARLLLYTSTDRRTAETSGHSRWPEPASRFRCSDAADERYGTLSPDGRWLAYISNVSGDLPGYVEAFPVTGIKRQVSTRAASSRSGDATAGSCSTGSRSDVDVRGRRRAIGDVAFSHRGRCFPRASRGWRSRRWPATTLLPATVRASCQRRDRRSPIHTADRRAQLDGQSESEQVKRLDQTPQ